MATLLEKMHRAIIRGSRVSDALAMEAMDEIQMLREGIQEAADEIERLRSLTIWQFIETAPLDGTAIALLFKHDLRKGDYDKDGALWLVRAEKGEAWWMANANKPIAWLPLPTPPEADT